MAAHYLSCSCAPKDARWQHPRRWWVRQWPVHCGRVRVDAEAVWHATYGGDSGRGAERMETVCIVRQLVAGGGAHLRRLKTRTLDSRATRQWREWWFCQRANFSSPRKGERWWLWFYYRWWFAVFGFAACASVKIRTLPSRRRFIVLSEIRR